MISTETITARIQTLPISSQKEVLEFVDELLERSAKSSQTEKASAWEDWAKSHSENAVVVDDRREAIYAEND